MSKTHSSPPFHPQDLPRAVAERLSQLGVRSGERMVVAVSGGLDSMVLLRVLTALGELDLALTVAHLDHRLRPESRSDAEFVESASAELGLSCTTGARDVAGFAAKRRQSLEEAARTLRYEFLDRVMRETNSSRIVLGHHADDQAETVLLRLLRGSGTTGLSGMAALREERYVRPLLSFDRRTLADYAARERIPFREDRSNSDLRFARNRIRHELIPHLESAYNPNIVRTLGRTAQLLRDEDDALNEAAQEALETVVYARSPQIVILAAPLLLRYHIAIQRRVLRELMQGLATPARVGFDQIEAALEVARNPSSTMRRLPQNVWAQRAGERFILRRRQPLTADLPIGVPGRAQISERDLSFEAELMPAGCFDELRPSLGGWCAAFDSEIAKMPLALRAARAGDRIQPLGMRGSHKKLSDILVDAKWPRILREDVLVLTRRRGELAGDDEEIVWVVGFRVCDRFRVTEASMKIVYMKLSGAVY